MSFSFYCFVSMRAKVNISGRISTYNAVNMTESQLQTLKKRWESKEQREYKYKLNGVALRNAASKQAARYKRIFFMTLTVSNTIEHTHKTLNKSFNLFITNLRNNYGLKTYLAVAERQKNGSIHYHVLCTFTSQRLNFAFINNAWLSAINTIHYSKFDAVNSVRFGGVKKNGKRYYYIYDQLHAIKYITKYLYKENIQGYESKCYFMSEYLRYNTQHIIDEDNFYDFIAYIKTKQHKIWSNEYVSIYELDAKDVLFMFNLNYIE